MTTFDTFARRIDLKYSLPRPALRQHLSSHHALKEYLQVLTLCGLVILTSLLACVSFFVIPWALKLGPEYFAYATLAVVVDLILAFAACLEVYVGTYDWFFHSETHGKAQWATLAHLKERGFVRLRPELEREDVSPKLAFGTFGPRHEIALALPHVPHFAVYGPPGCGKTISLFLPIARQWAALGAAVILDLKRQLFTHAAHYYEAVHLVDLIDWECSHRLPLLERCRSNPQFAFELACLIVGYDSSKERSGDNDFFQHSSSNLLKLLLLHVAHGNPTGSLGDVSRFLGENLVADPETKQPKLNEALMRSPAPGVAQECLAFLSTEERTRSNIVITLDTILKSFQTPAAEVIFSAPTPFEEQGGARTMDLRDLRKRGAAFFVAVSEGDVDKYKVLLTTIFGLFAQELRKSSETDVHCLMLLDEAGNFPIIGLEKDIGVGRGRKMAYGLGFQTVEQAYKLYGEFGGKAIVQMINSSFFLPGCTGSTAELLGHLVGKTTTTQNTQTDSPGSANDQDRHAEVGTELITPAEVRGLLPYEEAIAVIKTAHPIRMRVFSDATGHSRRRSRPQRFVIDPARPFVAPSTSLPDEPAPVSHGG